jgi:SAM-dependent methyltransferase
MSAIPTNFTRDPDSVREFFNGWALYRRIVDNNYLCHRSVREAFGEWLDRHDRPFSFLDLGCGDAEFTAGLLRGKPLISYTGIDLSPVALDLAAKNTADLPAPCMLQMGDFLTTLSTLPESYDLIYIGLSLHHLPRREKEFFFTELRRKLKQGGNLLIFDPVLNPGESRECYLGRWVDHAKWFWKALSVEDVDDAVEHVTNCDYPEEVATLNHMAVSAGFQAAEILFADRADFYALMAFKGA